MKKNKKKQKLTIWIQNTKSRYKVNENKTRNYWKIFATIRIQNYDDSVDSGREVKKKTKNTRLLNHMRCLYLS